MISALILSLFTQILENGTLSTEKLIEITVNITFYSVTAEIIEIGVIIIHVLVLFIGLRILVRQVRAGQKLLFFSVLFLVLIVIIDPIYYFLLAKGINWAIIGTIGDVSELIRLAILSDPVLLTFHLLSAFLILGDAIAFASLLFTLDGKSTVKKLKIVGLLYLVQTANFGFSFLILINLPYSIFRLLVFPITAIILFSFLVLGTNLRRIEN